MSFPSLAFFEDAAKKHGMTDAAHYTPAGGNAKAIDGKFTSIYVDPFGVADATAPAFTASMDQFDSGDPKQNDAVTVVRADGQPVEIAYRVKTAKPNTPSVGEVTLILKV